ncbi:MAG: 3D domain-containing protein, partial [Clostridia bacterium]|nr:3D domain-containing protein [Clostridia bacterium]
GASGQKLYAGSVAVNPNKIPYGTKMYITTPDNSFVFGYAIAADTGTGLMANIIDVDLFYDTYEESCWNGLRSVNIYILE